MKNKTIKILVFVLSVILLMGVCVSCNDNGEKDLNNASEISASLLDGKIANFMGAQAFGIKEKSEQEMGAYSDNANSPRKAYADEIITKQKNTEFTKETENGYADVHFYSKNDNRKSYADLNKKYEKHHHNAIECNLVDCAEISDEIANEENLDKSGTIISLDARINKLYNHKNFTFMSVSSKVSGEIEVVCNYYRPVLDTSNFMALKHGEGYPTLVNIENHFNSTGGSWGFGYIKVNESGDKPSGIIPIKTNENETGYHSSNYWSDNYNQSYIIDNNTGVTYSLSRFPYIYSVYNGIIKVYDENEVGWFKYYEPVITQNGLSFNQINLPTDEGFVSSVPTLGSGSSVLIDIYGNMLFNAVGHVAQGLSTNEYGEARFGEKVILATTSQQVCNELQQAFNSPVQSNIILERYRKANRYHMGSDGKIYRVDFRGLLSDVKVDVLDENCSWQQVDGNTSITFDNFFGLIAWWVGENKQRIDCFRITEISNGYAYYSTACTSDGGHVFDSVEIISNWLLDLGDYTGVVKIPVTGREADNSHLDFIKQIKQAGVNLNKNYNVFLIGRSQMLYLNENKITIKDVKTGKENSITSSSQQTLASISGNNLVFNVNGQTKYLNVLQQVDVENFSQALSDSPVKIGGELDAYFKQVTQQ